jgi:hypothetical protein
MIFPNSNLPLASQAWGREVTKQLSNIIDQTTSNEINNAARDNQLNSAIIAIGNNATAASAAASTANTAATDAGNAATAAADAATVANDSISRLQTYTTTALGSAAAQTFSNTTGTIASFSKSFTVDTTGGGTRTAMINATCTVDLGMTGSGTATPQRIRIIQQVVVNSTYSSSTTTRIGYAQNVTQSVYGGGSLTCSISCPVSNGTNSISIYHTLSNESTAGTQTWSGSVTLDSVNVSVIGA